MKPTQIILGMDYHNGAANAHTISIKITNEYEGVLRTVHDTTLAGTTEVYGSGKDPMPALAYFTIDSPGVWRVRVKSKASGSCADPRLDINERFTVPTPTGWGQTDSPTESQITPSRPCGNYYSNQHYPSRPENRCESFSLSGCDHWSRWSFTLCFA